MVVGSLHIYILIIYLNHIRKRRPAMSNTKTINIFSEKLNKNLDINIIGDCVVIGDIAKAHDTGSLNCQRHNIWNNVWNNMPGWYNTTWCQWYNSTAQ